MRIRVPQSRRRLDRISLNLASMIDVTFLLLVYFIVTMVLLPPEDRLSPMLQTQAEAAGPTSDLQPQVIEVRRIDERPAYRLGTRVFSRKRDLAAALQPLPKSAGVFVHVFEHVPVEFAVAAMQAAHDAGFEQVTYVPGEP